MGIRASRADAEKVLASARTAVGVNPAALGVADVPSDPSEKEFQAAVVREADRRGWSLCYHTKDSRRSEPGFPDLVLGRFRDGRLLVAELKVGKNTATPEQEAWLAMFRAAGVEAHLWRPEDWERIRKTLA